MVRPLTFLKGPRSLCEHIFGQFSLETLFFVHLQHVIHLGGVKCRTYRGSVQKTAFWVLLQRNFFFNQNRNTHQLHQIRTLNKKKMWKIVWSLAPFWTWPGRTPGLSTIGLFRPKGGQTTQKPCTDQKNQKNRKKWKTFPRHKNAQNSPQNTFAQQFGHRDLKWRPGCATEKKGPKTAVFDPKNGPFWTPDSGPRVPPDAQNQKIFKSCHDSWKLCLQRRQPAKKWKKMVRPLIFLKGPGSLCEHNFWPI